MLASEDDVADPLDPSDGNPDDEDLHDAEEQPSRSCICCVVLLCQSGDLEMAMTKAKSDFPRLTDFTPGDGTLL